MKRMNLIGTLIIATLILGIVGCQMFDDSPTGVSAPAADNSVLGQYIMGTPELDDWGAYYVKDDTFLRVDLPVSGAIKVEYSVTRGWKGAVFVQTGAPVGLEIGLNTIDGETDEITNVCVSYVEGGTFSSVPENVEESFQDTDGNWTHYKQVMDDGSTRDWWPATAAFEFSGDTTTTCAVEDGEVQWDVIPGGAFEKPAGSAASAGTAIPTVTSKTGQVWMDRNLGAVRVAQSVDDSEAYGHLYQWGRPADGHEARTSLTTTSLADSDVPGHAMFIRGADWRQPSNDDLWKDGQGPCPPGFSVPTRAQWRLETVAYPDGLFASPLRIPLAGWRYSIGGNINGEGGDGAYWTAAPYPGEPFAWAVLAGNGAHVRYHRGSGLSIRCIQQ